MSVKYSALRVLLFCVFSMEMCLPEELRRLELERFLSEPDVRLRLRNELIQFERSGDSWVELLSNDLYCVDCMTSEENARQYIMDLFGSMLLE